VAKQHATNVAAVSIASRIATSPTATWRARLVLRTSARVEVVVGKRPRGAAEMSVDMNPAPLGHLLNGVRPPATWAKCGLSAELLAARRDQVPRRRPPQERAYSMGGREHNRARRGGRILAVENGLCVG
jgi:hypothetical protein